MNPSVQRGLKFEYSVISEVALSSKLKFRETVTNVTAEAPEGCDA